jgi:anti-sigma B factor antagonist
MKYSIDKQENYTILELQEDNLNSLMAPSLKSEFVILKNEGIKNLILNLTPVKYVDSSGLSAILTANRLWSADGMFVLTGIVHDSVKKLIEISRLDSVIHVIPSVEESVAALLAAQAEEDAGAADSDNA